MIKICLFDLILGSSPPNEKDTLEFELKIKCSNNKDSSKKESSRAEDIYKNSNGMLISFYIFSDLFKLLFY